MAVETRAGDLIIDGARALIDREGSPRLVDDVSIGVHGDRVVKVEEGRIRGVARRIDARRLLVLPGLISGHTHMCPGIPSRGLIEEGRSAFRVYELMEALDDEALDDLTAISLAEVLRSGCTTQIEMSFSQRQCESYVRVARRLGVRGYPGAATPPAHRWRDVWDGTSQAVVSYENEALRAIARFREFALMVNGSENDRIRPMATPHAPDTQTEATLQAWLSVARELGNGIHVHLAQTVTELERTRRRVGLSSIEWLDQQGLFNERLFGAHLSGINLATDLPVLQRAKAFTYTHNPSALGSGGESACQPYPEMLAAGINTSIGLDSHARDLLEQLKLATLFGRARCYVLPNGEDAPARRVPRVLDAVLSATRNAADGLGRKDLGRIAPGAKADLCGIDVTSFPAGPGTMPPEPLNVLLYTNGTAVRLVMTDGQIQVLDGRLLVHDELRLRARGAQVMRGIWAQLHAEGAYETEPSFPPGWPWCWAVRNGPSTSTHGTRTR